MEIFVLGAAHSGKSEWASARLDADEPTTFIGTAVVNGLEERIRDLRSRRSPSWTNVELGDQDLAGALALALASDSQQILVDSLNLWLANFLIESWAKYDKEQHTARLRLEVDRIQALLQQSNASKKTLIFVSSEVGAGVTPPDELARFFRQQLGWINQIFAARANEVIQIVSGIPLIIKKHA